MKNNKYVSVVPARGGSKRLPHKNILNLKGKPLICYSIEYSLCEMPDIPVYVTTDDIQIACVAKQNGSRCIDRPDELATDLSTTASALQHAAKQILSQGVDFEYMILLQPTNPLRPEGLLKEAMSILENNLQYDSLMTVSPLIKKMGRIKEHQFIPWNYFYGQRSQDLEPLYYENGLLYITHKSLILEGEIMSKNMYPLIVDHIFGSIDIDTSDDFTLAEYFIERNNGR